MANSNIAHTTGARSGIGDDPSSGGDYRPAERVAYTPDGASAWLRYLGIARLGVLSFVCLGAAFMDVGRGEAYLFLLYAFAFLTGLSYLYTLGIEKAIGKQQAWAQILVDFSVIAFTVALTEGPTSFFIFMFIVVVLEAGLLLGLSQGFIIATLASAFILQQMFSNAAGAAQVRNFQLWYDFLVQCLAFYLTAFISSYWNQRINRLQQFQREILDNMNSGFIMTDAFGTITVQNKAAHNILATDQVDSIGRDVSEVLRVENGGECPVTTALRSGQDFTSYEFRAATGDPDGRLIGLTTNRMFDARGHVTGMIVAFTDLTEMNEIRQELQQHDRMAVIGELAAGLAHEIRNPVTVIRGSLEQSRDGACDPATIAKLRDMAIRESDHLNEIVSGFLDFARTPSVKRETFDLRDIVTEVAGILGKKFEESPALRISVQQPEHPCLTSGDPSQIKQVFMNLGNNGIEAMDRHGLLTICVRDGEGPVEARFDDEGPGIDPDKISRIFEPFYTTKSSGVGMGLSVCLRIVTAHDGTIQASSREGGGCSMSVRLPAYRTTEEPCYV